MEEKKIEIPVWKTEDGKIIFHVNEISRKLNEGVYQKGSLIKEEKNNITRFTGNYYGEYVDIPEEDEKKTEVKGLEGIFINLIEDGTRIIGRRNKRGIRK